MRNPFPLLAAVLFAATGASAAALPTWTVQDQLWGSWRVVNFTDATGKSRELWCRWEECNWHNKSGKARLYVFERQSSESYTYKEHWYSPGSPSAKATYSTLLSQYELDMSAKPHKATVAGTKLAFAVEDRKQLTPVGYILRVLPPKGIANDLPAAKPGTTKPKQPAKKPSRQAGNPKKPAETKPIEPGVPQDGSKTDTGAVTGALDKFNLLSPDEKKKFCESAKSPSDDIKAACQKILEAARTGPLTDEELKQLKANQRAFDDYNSEIKAAAGDPDKLTAVYKKYRDYLAFKKMSRKDANKKCKDFPPSQVAANTSKPNCDSAAADVGKAMSACLAIKNADKTKQEAERNACAEKIKACGSGGVSQQTNKSSVPQPYTADCAALADNGAWWDDHKDQEQPKKGKGIDNLNCNAGKSKSAATSGADTEPCPSKEQKEDKNFYSNLANGTAFAIAGLVLGSFFGGPLVAVAFAAAAGVGAYFLSKKINTPKDDK